MRVYVIPGAVLQSVIVGGGYGTGREIVEYFTQYGPLGGLLAMFVTAICFWVVLGATYEFARVFQVYDYRNFFKVLIGPAWPIFEVLYVLMLILTLAVVASAAGEILRESFDLPYALGLTMILVLIGVLVFFGRDVIAKVLTLWSFFLYAVFGIYFVLAFSRFPEMIGGAFLESDLGEGWMLSGFKYAMYNLSIVPAILFAMRDIETRKEAIGSAAMSALICLVPALMFHITFVSGIPEIYEQTVPIYWMTGRIGASFLVILYVVVLFGTFVETGAGFIQGINERIDVYLQETNKPPLRNLTRSAIGIVGMLGSAGLATLGIVRLIADGYGTMAWAFLIIYVFPVVTYGIYLINSKSNTTDQPKSD
jgi:uncharacterized membrane protein YkvI